MTTILLEPLIYLTIVAAIFTVVSLGIMSALGRSRTIRVIGLICWITLCSAGYLLCIITQAAADPTCLDLIALALALVFVGFGLVFTLLLADGPVVSDPIH